MKKLYYCLVMLLLLCSCSSDVPLADNKPPAEQQKHTIRILARNVNPGADPSIFLIEVDGKTYVIVYGYGIAKHKD